MEIILAHNHYSQEHLKEVKKEMETMGAPTIKVVNLGYGEYMALEGCHRIRAAKELGLTPKLTIFDYDEIKDILLTDESLGLDFDNYEPVSWLYSFIDDRISIEF